MKSVFLDDGADITKIINPAIKEDFLKLKIGDTFKMHWEREESLEYEVTYIAKDDNKDTHISAKEINI